MNLQEFKALCGVATLPMYKSTKSDRFVGSVGAINFVTTVDFDASKEAHVYPNPVIEDGNHFVISNTIKRAADMVL